MQGATETESPDAWLGEEPQTRVGAKIEPWRQLHRDMSFIFNVNCFTENDHGGLWRSGAVLPEQSD